MATTLYLRNNNSIITTDRWSSGNNDNRVNLNSSGWERHGLSASQGIGATTGTATSIAGPVDGFEPSGTSGLPLHFVSAPLTADVTISGTITVNVWMNESGMNANAMAGCVIERINSAGAIVSVIAQGTQGTELATSSSAENWTMTPTSTAMKKGDRIRVRVYFDDAGTMGAGFTLTATYDGPTTGSNGDSYVSFTETFTTEGTPGGGTTLHLTNATTKVPSTSDTDYEAKLGTQGGGVVTDSVATAPGWRAPIQFAATPISWWTPPLEAVTLGGTAQVDIRAGEGTSSGNASMRIEVAVCDGDGTNAVVWGANCTDEELSTTATNLVRFAVSGPDTAISAGQRIRIRLFVDDFSQAPMGSLVTVTVRFSGTAVGDDTLVILPVTITEQVAGVTCTPGTASLTLTPQTPVVQTPVMATPGAASLALAAQTPAVTVGVNVVPGTAGLTLTLQAPTVLTPRLVTPGTASLALTAQTPAAIVNNIAVPGVASLSLAAQLPSVVIGNVVVPGAAALTLTPQLPSVQTPRLATPGTATLALTPFAPAVATPRLVVPGTLALTLTPQTPVVQTPVTATPGALALALTPFAPTVTAGSGGAPVTVVPGTAALALGVFAPTVTATDHQLVVPGSASLALTPFAPTVLAPRLVVPGTATLALTPFAPTAATPVMATPGPSSLALTPFAPTVTATNNIAVTPGAAALALATFAPGVVLPVTSSPGVATLALTPFAPTVGFGVSAIPGTAALTLTLFPPVVTATSLAVIAGITKSASGIPIGSCEVHLFRTADDVEIGQMTSDAGGNFAFTVADTTTHYYVVAYKVGAPDRAGTTRNDLTGA